MAPSSLFGALQSASLVGGRRVVFHSEGSPLPLQFIVVLASPNQQNSVILIEFIDTLMVLTARS